MVKPNSLVQFTPEAVDEYLRKFGENPDGMDPLARREKLRRLPNISLFKHAGFLFLNEMSDEPGSGIFATHGHEIFWGYPLIEVEPYNSDDHGPEFG